VDGGGADAVEVLVVAGDPPLPLRIITAATAAIMMITTTIPPIRRVVEDEDDELELVATIVVVPVEFVLIADVEVLGAALDEAELFVLKVVEDAAALEEVVGGGTLEEALDDVVVEEPTNDALSSDCIFKDPQ
jgi:hypothetical protein